MATALVLAGNTLLPTLVNAIDRAPLDGTATEASYEVRAVAKNGEVKRGGETCWSRSWSPPTIRSAT